jgi:hypothetical protein
VAVDRLIELMGTLLFLSLGGIVVLPSLVENSAAMLTVMAVMAGVILVIGVLLYTLATGDAPLSRLIGRAAQWIGWQKGVPNLVASLQAGERQASGILTDRLCGWYALGGLLQWSGFLAELWMIYAFMGTPLSVLRAADRGRGGPAGFPAAPARWPWGVGSQPDAGVDQPGRRSGGGRRGLWHHAGARPGGDLHRCGLALPWRPSSFRKKPLRPPCGD